MSHPRAFSTSEARVESYARTPIRAREHPAATVGQCWTTSAKLIGRSGRTIPRSGRCAADDSTSRFASRKSSGMRHRFSPLFISPFPASAPSPELSPSKPFPVLYHFQHCPTVAAGCERARMGVRAYDSTLAYARRKSSGVRHRFSPLFISPFPVPASRRRNAISENRVAPRLFRTFRQARTVFCSHSHHK